MTVSDAFEKLKMSVEKAVKELELPHSLAESVMEIASNPKRFASKTTIVNDLADMILDFHTYAEARCEKLGASVKDIEYVVDYIKASAEQTKVK